MKRMLKFLARLYPPAWRARYGAELEALLDQGTPRTRDAFDLLWGAFKMQLITWNSAKLVLACMLAGTLAAFAFSFARPALYRSQTLITVRTADPRSLDRKLADLLTGTLTEQTAIEMIEKWNLYPSERARMPMNAVADLMRKNIRILPLQMSAVVSAVADLRRKHPWIHPLATANGFVVQFDYPDPRIAQRVDADLVSRITFEDLTTARREAAAATDYLKEQLARANGPANVDPQTKARIQSQLQQAEAAQTAVFELRGEQSPWPILDVLAAPSLPQKPSYPNRPLFGAAGLLAGLAGGLMLAWALRSWQKATVANG